MNTKINVDVDVIRNIRTTSQTTTYLTLCIYREMNVFFPSYPELAMMSKTSKRAIIQFVRELEEQGYVKKITIFSNSGKAKRHFYIIKDSYYREEFNKYKMANGEITEEEYDIHLFESKGGNNF